MKLIRGNRNSTAIDSIKMLNSYIRDLYNRMLTNRVNSDTNEVKDIERDCSNVIFQCYVKFELNEDHRVYPIRLGIDQNGKFCSVFGIRDPFIVLPYVPIIKRDSNEEEYLEMITISYDDLNVLAYLKTVHQWLCSGSYVDMCAIGGAVSTTTDDCIIGIKQADDAYVFTKSTEPWLLEFMAKANKSDIERREKDSNVIEMDKIMENLFKDVK